MTENERYEMLMQKPNAVFVFGSNKSGAHAGGAARAATEYYGAVWGKAEGLQGRSYAIPTMGGLGYPTLPLHEIQVYVTEFLDYARANQEKTFVLTRVGCGIAGYRDEEVAPLFDGAPANVVFPEAWRIKQGIGRSRFTHGYVRVEVPLV